MKKGGTKLTLERVNSIKKWDQSWEKTLLVMKLKSAEEKKKWQSKDTNATFLKFFIHTFKNQKHYDTQIIVCSIYNRLLIPDYI